MDLGLNNNINADKNININPQVKVNPQIDNSVNISEITVFYFIMCSLQSRLHSTKMKLKEEEKDFVMKQAAEIMLSKMGGALGRRINLLEWLKKVCKDENNEFVGWLKGMDIKFTKAKHEIDQAILDCKAALEKLKKEESKGGIWGFISSKILGIKIKINKKIKELQKKLHSLTNKTDYSVEDMKKISDTATQLVQEVQKAVQSFWITAAMGFLDHIATKYVTKAFQDPNAKIGHTQKVTDEWIARIVVFGSIILVAGCLDLGGAVAAIIGSLALIQLGDQKGCIQLDYFRDIVEDTQANYSVAQLTDNAAQLKVQEDMQAVNMMVQSKRKAEEEYDNSLKESKMFGDLLTKQTQQLRI